jgi:hypothetical protein
MHDGYKSICIYVYHVRTHAAAGTLDSFKVTDRRNARIVPIYVRWRTYKDERKLDDDALPVQMPGATTPPAGNRAPCDESVHAQAANASADTPSHCRNNRMRLIESARRGFRNPK